MARVPTPDPPRILTMVYNDIRRDARVRRVSEALARRYDVTLVSIAPRDSTPLADVGFRIIELPIDHLGRFPRSKYVLYWLRAFLRSRHRSFDAIHCHDIYPMPPAAVLARLAGVPLIYDSHELVDHASSETSFIGRFWDATHRWAVRRSDLVITANESRARFLVQNGYRPRCPPVPVMNIGDRSEAPREAAGDAALREAGVPPGRYVVIYQGWIAHARRTVQLVESLERLPGDIHLLLVGDGPAMTDVRERVGELGLESRVHLTGYVSKDRVLELVAGSDVGVVLYDDVVLNNYYCAPNKLFDYLNAGIPVIASDLPEPRKVLGESGAGVLVRDATPDGLSEAILRARSLRPTPADFEVIRSRYRWDVEIDRLLDAYERFVFDGESLE